MASGERDGSVSLPGHLPARRNSFEGAENPEDPLTPRKDLRDLNDIKDINDIGVTVP